MPGIKYESYIYEGYGPKGIALLIEVLTDNKNRTVPEIRHLLSKNNGNLGESGCVNWMFEKKGTILIKKENLDEELFINDLLELDIDTYDEYDDEFQLIVSPEDFSDIIKNLEDKKYDIEGDISLVPINTIAITSNDLEQVSNLIDKLEDHDDIQKVHTNLEVLD